jgi:hypothetical protein
MRIGGEKQTERRRRMKKLFNKIVVALGDDPESAW